MMSHRDVEQVRRRAQELCDLPDAAPDVTQRLASSVVRPLGGPSASDASGESGSLAERLPSLAIDATRLGSVASEVTEAIAALQDLACELVDDPDALLAELRQIQADRAPEVRVAAGGPYLVTNIEDLRNWLGEHVPARPTMALCRCGASARKPFCDGSHARIGFTDTKDPNRVPDRRDTYVGQQVTVLDNRGICQHSGFCSDRLASVFHAGEEPFITPSGGRMDEIVRAVRDCPSGALSFAIDGREAREQVDFGAAREPAIEVSKDGPYRVTGGVPLRDDAGADEARAAGASRDHYALCRCGHSQNKPFCSGMHWYVEFRDPVPDPERAPTLFEWCGGLPALTKMTRLFYEKHVPQDPLLGPLFATMSADHPQRVAKWLAEVFGGPERYSAEHGGYPRMLSQHAGKGLTEEQRARWVALIGRAAQEAGLPTDPEFRSAFTSYLEWGSRLALENSQPGAHAPEQMPMPRWDWGTAGAPGGRVSALEPASEDEPPVTLPAAGEPVGFERHIKALFRERDRRSMRFAFDLWAYDDVKRNADAILERVRAGSMPCDGAWPSEYVDAFERWVATGTSP
jgi:CDGSH-type Zn-finger protein/truncated hemoglobin YjbI